MAARPATPARPATVLRPAAPVKAAIGEPLVDEAPVHGSHEPEAAEVASGVALVAQVPQVPVEVASGVAELAPVHGSHEPLADEVASGDAAPVHGSHEPEAASGVALDEQEVEVLVQTGTEMVHGQSVTVKVVEAVMV